MHTEIQEQKPSKGRWADLEGEDVCWVGGTNAETIGAVAAEAASTTTAGARGAAAAGATGMHAVAPDARSAVNPAAREPARGDREDAAKVTTLGCRAGGPRTPRARDIRNLEKMAHRTQRRQRMLADGDALEPNQPGKLPEVPSVREDPDPGIAEATLKQVLDKLQQLGGNVAVETLKAAGLAGGPLLAAQRLLR